MQKTKKNQRKLHTYPKNITMISTYKLINKETFNIITQNLILHKIPQMKRTKSNVNIVQSDKQLMLPKKILNNANLLPTTNNAGLKNGTDQTVEHAQSF